MDWLFKNLGVFIFIAIAVASMLSKLRKAATQSQARKALEPVRTGDSEAASRTRQIQEEIRRKIAQRAGRVPTAAVPPVMARPAAQPPALPPQNIFEELKRQMARAEKFAADAQVQLREIDEEAEREEAETRRLAEARRKQQEAQRAAETSTIYRASAPSAASDRRSKLLAALREPQSLREALVLREILGAPPGLR
ncbi:MAG TPA: hypothetical protein VFB27_05960 [Opitutaceae bacterium]|nr:hypothetical protein [Opitutaceae bacterium]